MKVRTVRKVGSPTRNGVAVASFAEWLKRVPPGAPKDTGSIVEIPITLRLQASELMCLALGASAHGWTLEQCVAELVSDGGPGVWEWQNRDFPNLREDAPLPKKMKAELDALLKSIKEDQR